MARNRTSAGRNVEPNDAQVKPLELRSTIKALLRGDRSLRDSSAIKAERSGIQQERAEFVCHLLEEKARTSPQFSREAERVESLSPRSRSRNRAFCIVIAVEYMQFDGQHVCHATWLDVSREDVARRSLLCSSQSCRFSRSGARTQGKGHKGD